MIGNGDDEDAAAGAERFLARFQGMIEAEIVVPDPVALDSKKVAWTRLLSGLEEAQQIDREVDPEGRQAQWASIAALKAAIEFIDASIPSAPETGLSWPLRRLYGDLLSLERGHQPKRLERTLDGTKDRPSAQELAVSWHAAFAMHELTEAGFSNDEAAAKVARAVAKTGKAPRSGAELAGTVKNWRATHMQDGKAFNEELQEWRAGYRAHHRSEGKPEQRAAYLIRLIERTKL